MNVANPFGNTVGQHSFAMIPRAEIPRSVFNRSCGVKTTFNSGYLVPIFVDEALPGDTINLRMSSFCRMSTPQFPFMDNLFMDVFFFAVPIRLIWDNWKKFNGEQANPDDSTDFEIPQIVAPAGGWTIGSLADYFGIRTGVAGLSHSSLWHRAYNLIWNEWFRDENLQDSLVVDKDDGPDTPADYVVRRRGKRHDYFTSCLPFPQKGTAVTLPLGTSAPVSISPNPASFNEPSFVAEGGSTVRKLQGVNAANTVQGSANWDATGVLNWSDPALIGVADLSSATAATINQIREAFQIQRLFERDARGGSRYTEIIRSHFGVVSPDARLQRPEFLGGGSARIHVNPVAQTGQDNGLGLPVGSLAAFVTGSMQGVGFVKSFTEHCVLIGLVNVRADLSYQQGIPRMFSRLTRFDFYWPALAHLGEQAVLNKEIFAQNTAADDEVFGYQERYAEYRYKPSMVTGDFRSDSPASLDVWHLAQDFSALPVLNDSFIVDDPPVVRTLANVTTWQWLFDSYFDFKHVRPMPTYSVPGLIDHF